MQYKIELKYSSGWDDAEWADEKDGKISPTRFGTICEAQAALDIFFAEVKAAVIAGSMNTECYGDDYRIVAANG